MRERGSVYTRARLRNRHAGHPPVFERRKKNSRVSGTIDRRFLSIRGSPLLSIETRFKISPVPHAVCVAPRPREPGSHVIMAEVAEKKRFEVKKVRTTRVRRFSRGARALPARLNRNPRAFFTRRDTHDEPHADPHPVSRNSGTPSRCGRGPARTRVRFAAPASRPSSTRRAPRRRVVIAWGNCGRVPPGLHLQVLRALELPAVQQKWEFAKIEKTLPVMGVGTPETDERRGATAATRLTATRVVKEPVKTNVQRLLRVCFAFRADELDASPSSPRPRNTRSSRGCVPITPHSRPPTTSWTNENRASRETSSRENEK